MEFMEKPFITCEIIFYAVKKKSPHNFLLQIDRKTDFEGKNSRLTWNCVLGFEDLISLCVLMHFKDFINLLDYLQSTYR